MSDLHDLLERAADRPSTEPDFEALARTGTRRRYTQRAVTALAVIAVLALTSSVVLPQLRPPAVLFDSGPRVGVGRWEPIPAGPLGPRTDAQSTSDDRRVVILGGQMTDAHGSDEWRRNGAVFDLRERTWQTIPAPPLTTREFSGFDRLQLLDDGRLMVLTGDPLQAAFYDFETRRWEATGAADVSGRDLDAFVWTGQHLIVWGGWTERGERADGAVWSAERGWTVMADSPLAARTEFAWSWTGDTLLVWGGGAGNADRGEHERVFDDGAAYDPVANSWSALPPSPLSARQGADALWDGDTWVVMGGRAAATPIEGAKGPQTRDLPTTSECSGGTCSGSSGIAVQEEPQSVGGGDFTDGASYDPVRQRWQRVSRPPQGFRAYAGLAYGSLISYGGEGYAEYDSAADSWAPRPAPVVATTLSAWDAEDVSGTPVLVNSGPMLGMNDTDRPRRLGGLALNREASRWDALTEADTPQRYGAVVEAAGNQLFVWGGTSVTEDISGGYRGGNPWHEHDDGAVLTVD